MGPGVAMSEHPCSSRGTSPHLYSIYSFLTNACEATLTLSSPLKDDSFHGAMSPVTEPLARLGVHVIRCYLHPLIYWYIDGIQIFYVEAT